MSDEVLYDIHGVGITVITGKSWYIKQLYSTPEAAEAAGKEKGQ